MKLFFAGAEPKMWQKFLMDNEAENILQSYWYIKSQNAPVYNTPNNELLIDSGGYTARIKGIQIPPEEYAEWLNENKIKVAFNLDTNDLQETMENQKYLERATNTYIIPIYHLTDYLSERELLDDFMEYPYIGISAGGASPEFRSRALRLEFIDYVFSKTQNKIAVHGLGMTSETLMKRYPYFSVDSTSWLSSSRYGNSLDGDGGKLQVYRSKKTHYMVRTKEEFKKWRIKEKMIQALWHHRGVSWPTSLSTLLSTWTSSRKPHGITKQTILRKQKNSSTELSSADKSLTSSFESLAKASTK